MTTREYLDSKEVRLKELEDNFAEVKRYSKDMLRFPEKTCPNCEDKINAHSRPSQSWTSCKYCTACKCISIILWADRQGGQFEDIVIVYKNKEKAKDQNYDELTPEKFDSFIESIAIQPPEFFNDEKT